MNYEKITTATAEHWLSGDGILWVHHTGKSQVLADAQGNVAASRRAAQGRRWPMLVDMSGIKQLDREARREYSKTDNAETITACAVVVGNPLNRMIGNFFLGFHHPAVPTRLFDTRQAAAAWLRKPPAAAA